MDTNDFDTDEPTPCDCGSTETSEIFADDRYQREQSILVCAGCGRDG